MLLPPAIFWRQEVSIFTFVFCRCFHGGSSLRKCHCSRLTWFGHRTRTANGGCPVLGNRMARNARLKTLPRPATLKRLQLGRRRRLRLQVRRGRRRNHSRPPSTRPRPYSFP